LKKHDAIFLLFLIVKFCKGNKTGSKHRSSSADSNYENLQLLIVKKQTILMKRNIVLEVAISSYHWKS